jgi:hypothetical protein
MVSAAARGVLMTSRETRGRTIVGDGSNSSTAPVSTRLIETRASPMSRKRSFGSLSRHRLSRRRTLAETAGGMADHSGSVLSTAANVVEMSSPSNARRPVSISYSTHPNAQISTRLSTALPRACSGAMYAAVPMMPSYCASWSQEWGSQFDAGRREYALATRRFDVGGKGNAPAAVQVLMAVHMTLFEPIVEHTFVHTEPSSDFRNR